MSIPPSPDKMFSKTMPTPGMSAGKSSKNDKDKNPFSGTLDHNNMMKTVAVHKGESKYVKKIKKTTKAPPVRAYPGELHVVKKNSTETMNYEEWAKEEAAILEASNLNRELTSEDLMRDPEYLKIDQSKLPLEIFDNIELEMLDRPPQEWVGGQGQTPYYHEGQWIWRPVDVKGYNEATKEFEVQFLPKGITKHVKRLNLKFDLEDPVKFETRRNVAEDARKEAKQTMRLDYYIEQQPKQNIRPIRKESIRHIHERVVEGLSVDVPFPEADTPLGNLLHRLTGEIIQFYSRTMKRTVLQARLRGVYQDENFKRRYNQLHLPPVPTKPPVPRNGKVACEEYPFGDRLLRIENLHVSATREVMAVHNWLHKKWVQVFQFYNFFETKVASFSLPATLQDFKSVQMSKHEAASVLMEKDFRRGFMDQFMDSVQDVFDFFQSSASVFKHGALFKLFRVLDLKLSTFMRSILLNSLKQLQDVVMMFTKDDEKADLLPVVDQAVAAAGNDADPASSESKAVSPREMTEEEEKMAKIKALLKKRRCETIFNLNCKIPLFQAELLLVNGKVTLEPSVEDFQTMFHQLIDKMVSSLRTITSIDKDAMSLLVLEPRVLLNVGTGDPLYADVDGITRKVKSIIADRLAKSMHAPMMLRKMYNSYSWIVKYDVNEYIEQFTERDPPPSSADFATELERINDAIKELNDLSFKFETFNLVRVDCTAISELFRTRATACRDALAQRLIVDARHMNKSIIEAYNSILLRIGEKPANEKQLADLRDFIETSKETVQELRKTANDTRRTLKTLDSYNIKLSIEDNWLSWSTMEYPSKVDHSGKEVEIALEADKIRMMDRLQAQKEKFEKDLVILEDEVKVGMKLSDYTDREKIFEKMNVIQDNINEAKAKGDDFNMREKVFGFALTDYSLLDKLTTELAPIYKLWSMVSDFDNSKNEWLNGEFRMLEGNKIEESVTDWWKTSYKLSKSLENDFPEVAECALKLREETTDFRKNMPVIQSLASKALKQRHWESLSDLLGKTIDPDAGDELTLQLLLDLDAAGHIESIQEISVAAEKEYNLERNMKAMIDEWGVIDFEVRAYKESGTFVVGGVDEIITLLDDHIVKTQTMRGSPFIKPIEKEIKDWEYRLKYAQGMLDAMIGCQRTWMYLEPIFGSEDIVKQLPTEARRFQGVDQLWRKTLAETNVDPNFMTQADPEKRLEEKFKKANEKLEEITKGLNDYLEMKRLYFPRFFFLSNDELLEILSQTKEPRAVQPHLGKCFEGINKVKFEDDLKISQMISAEGECVNLDKFVDPESSANKGNVEKWLLEIESIQWDSIRTLTVASLTEYPTIPRKDWLLHWPAQVILAVSCIFWTSEVSEALLNKGGPALVACNKKLDDQLKDIVVLVRGKLTKLERKTLGALTTIDVHNRDVVTKMVNTNINSISDFEWVSQFRYYWEDAWKDGQAAKKGEKTLVAKIVNAKCLYGYEYLGNTMRLVITALTDRCYRTMIGAVDLLYGGAPEGPAGTGKTETVKDLAKAISIHCVVFNCSDGLDYLAMAKFFKGLAGCGSWCCFDEFNRINIEVLSVIAQQILIINDAKREQKEMFMFEGTYMKLNTNCNVFITMNPGYAGRAELPDNLKALFRPCAMMVPDYGMIGEIRLYSFGFETARENAQKIVRVLQLSSEQLSSQKHYDYGMRAVNSILVAAGNLREQLGNDPDWTEARIVLRSINDVNLAKFLVEDLPLFRGITSDLFPGITLPEANYDILAPCLQDCCDVGVEVAPENTFFIENKIEYQTKTIQLYEMLLVRHGIMIVGQTCSGKTSVVHNLAKGLTKAAEDGHADFQKVQIFTINPKAVRNTQLYGLFDENTHEFVEGILAVTFRRCVKDTSPDRKWMMFDGPVDAVWIENMNTVLDDNKKLCLTSGEIIKMSDPMTMFFEAEDLEQASPATVSRVGMIFCETRNIGWQAVRNMWLKTSLPEALKDHKELLSKLFDWLFGPMTYFINKYCKQPNVMQPQELIFSLTRLLQSMLNFNDGAASDLPKVIEGCFIFSVIWTVGACVDEKGRVRFNELLRLMLSGDIYTTPEFDDFQIKNPDYVSDIERKYLNLPEGNAYDFTFDPKTAKWQSWMDNQPVFKIPREAQFNSIVVPTIDTIRNEWLIEKLLRNGFHVMCTGDTGTGKSVSLKNKLLSGMPDNFNSISLNFSAQTTANQTQDLIDSKLDKRRKGVLGPPLGMTTVIFVDDLNMPAKEEYGAQPPIEILRQWMDHRGWYDRKENEFRRLVDVQFCAAMGPPGGGRTRITQRYVRHFNLINFTNFSDESLGRVFGTILDWKLQQGFANPIKQLSGAAVSATIKVYNEISATLLPTPSKSHYTFNLRDLSKVFQGVLQGDATFVKDKDCFIRLWAHECMRVFHDRLIDEPDRTYFKKLVAGTVKELFNSDFAKIKGDHANPVFCNFGDPKSLSKPYVELSDRSNLATNMDNYLDDYNQMTTKPMNLVLFESAIEHIARISRIINQPYGNALLVGVGGSGRKSLTTLAISIADFSMFQIEITKSYSMFEWREDIKTMMKRAGVQNKPTVFMMDDTQIVQESFLEDINGILNTGEVANLFNNEEMGEVMESLQKPCAEAGVNAGIPAEVYNFFIGRVRTNLHLVLCLSPVGESFRTRLRMFPSLVNCCTIDWFTEWPEEALRSVANFFLNSIDLDTKIKTGVVDVCVDMQVRVGSLAKKYLSEMGRNYYVTPTSYLELINTFKNLLNKQRTDVFEQKARYDNGLSKLLETANQVNEMQVYLEDLQPKLKEATIETDALIVTVSADRIVANEQSVIVDAEAAKCNEQAKEAKALADSCEADLAEAIPALEAAEKALKNLDKSDITEMKAMKKPSMAIKMTMAAICIMMHVKPDKKVKDGDPRIDPYWGPATKELLGDSKFLQRLQTYDRDNMATAVVEQAKTFTNDPEFDPEVVAKKGSQAAAGLAKWVHAMVKYDGVARVVAPKKASLKEAQATLKEAQDNLAVKQGELKIVMDKVAALEAQLTAAKDKKDALNAQVIDCEAKLKRADALIKGLGGEKTRWTEMSKLLENTYNNVTGDIVLSAGVIAYLGAFIASYREDAIQQWSALLRTKGITCSEGFSLRDTLGSPVTIRQWIIDKLPNDSFSVENGIMLTKSNRWPLMIDPQGQANKWVKKMEEKNSLKVVKQNQGNFVRTLENAIQFGSPVLLENVPEYLDPILEPILLKQIVMSGGMATMRLGDSTVEYDMKFRLYITTKLSNPHYPPELCVKVNLLNFMATSEGLQDQMLGRVVAMEQKELELQRQHLIIEDAENQRQLKEIEDKILFLLKNAKGNILDDEVLIDTLGDSKKTSNIIQEKVKIAEQTQVRIAKVRLGYVPVAFQAAQLFFCIADLASVDPMYQYSLDWYIGLYEMSIDQADKSKVLDERLKNLNDCFTYNLYKNVCRSLFEKDKLLFSFLLATKLLVSSKALDAGELRFFLQGSTAMDLAEPNPFPDWLADTKWNDILAMVTLPSFADFKNQFMSEGKKWEEIMETTTPVEFTNALMGDKVDSFKKMCVLRCLRPDAVVHAVQLFVAEKMGTRFIEPPPFNMKECFADSKCTTPLIFVLTPGAAPMAELQKAADEMGLGDKLFAISLGQGQGPLAEKALQEAGDKGTWVCLQNCHLCVSWMPTLEKICEEFAEDSLHPNFRLWLTSEPSPAFPAYVLQNGVKMTIEPPKGMRANMMGSLSSVDPEWFDTSSRRNEFKKVLFGLCFFHAAVRERRKFGPLGWNISYVFSAPDLRISMDQLRIFMDDLKPEDPIPFAALAYLVGECNYGGRVTDDKDRRCIMNILSDFYCLDVIDDSYKFSPSGTYYAPPPGTLANYLEYVRALPLNEGPEVFGLHDNANISCAIAETNALLDTALSLQPRQAAGEGKSWGDILGELAHDIGARVPDEFDIERALILFPVRYDESMNTVLTQELLRFNKLINQVASSLVDVQKAIKGLVLMSQELEDMGNAMVIGKVPTMWSAVAYPSLKPLGSWVTDLLERLTFLSDWMENGVAPNVFWISGFFFTQAFITGTLQNFARKHSIPIDKAEFDFNVLRPEEHEPADHKKPEDGAYVRGLFIEGARWDPERHVLAESLPRELYTPMPYIQLAPKPKADVPVVEGIPEQYTGSLNGTAHVYMCPVYKTSFRQGTLSTTGHSTNFVMMLRIPMGEEHKQKHWIKRGVAMLTGLDT